MEQYSNVVVSPAMGLTNELKRKEMESGGLPILFDAIAKKHKGEFEETPSTKLKVHNLLNSSEESSELPSFFSFFVPAPVRPGNPVSTNSTCNITTSMPVPSVEVPAEKEQPVKQAIEEAQTVEEKNTIKFDKGNPNHVEMENINQLVASINNPNYEALKIQEITQAANGGPRVAKVQQLGLVCENLAFLELFTCKQMSSFVEGLKLPNLKMARLLMLNRLTNAGLAQLLTAAPNLETLYLLDLQTVTSITIPSTSHLKRLEISKCKNLETLQINSSALQELVISDGRGLATIALADPVNGLTNLQSLKLSGCLKLSLDFLYRLKIAKLKKLELVSNAPSAKAYMKVEEAGFDAFVKTNCTGLEDAVLDKVHNVSLPTVLMLIAQCKITLLNINLDLTSIEKPKVREALRHCDNLKDWKVEKWYIKKKWTEW